MVDFISHWHELIENYQGSSQEFYGLFEKAISARAVPQMAGSRVEYKEAGVGSAYREYLRLHRGKFAFDICAAPFGNGFFLSWWFTEPPLRFAWLYTIGFFITLPIAFFLADAIGTAVAASMFGFASGAFLGTFFAMVSVPVGLWLIGHGLRNGNIKGESTVLAIPIIGWLYEKIFAPDTFYAMDTRLMFQDAVHNAVIEVRDSMTTGKGVRALTEDARKPIMKRFAASV